MNEEDWRVKLSPEQYHILREKGTERPFTGQYNQFFEKGIYVCAGCGEELFTSEQKFNSSCGWPSFDDAIAGKIDESLDLSHGMVRTEITCKNCGGHLGHVFNDGPTKSGLRYCVNSLSLEFK
jgi:peptide-methionine (R)-S-oxide reductase